MRYLLDTNSCIAAMRNHPAMVQRMAQVLPDDCVVSKITGYETITGYELFTGVAKCADPAKEQAKVDLLLSTVRQVSFDTAAAKEAAQTRAHLESQGLTIGPYDLLLAGHALALSLIMVSANVKEFSRVPRLTVENWQV